jgi:hypothetical protein
MATLSILIEPANAEETTIANASELRATIVGPSDDVLDFVDAGISVAGVVESVTLSR